MSLFISHKEHEAILMLINSGLLGILQQDGNMASMIQLQEWLLVSVFWHFCINTDSRKQLVNLQAIKAQYSNLKCSLQACSLENTG